MRNLHNKAREDSLDTLENAVCGTDSKDTTCDRTNSDSVWLLFKNWPLMSSVIVYCIFSLQDMAYSEVIHIFSDIMFVHYKISVLKLMRY